MAYSPVVDAELAEEIPPGLETKLRRVLSVMHAPAFDRMAPVQRCRTILELEYALVGIAMVYLTRHPKTPNLYDSGIRYRYQPAAMGIDLPDQWWTLPTVYARGEGSCEDLAAIRVAELKLFGQTDYDRSARPVVHSKEGAGSAPSVYHVVVRFRDDQEEDPSYLLGMRPAWAA